MLLFALNATRALGLRVAEQLGVALSPHEEREFEDGEHRVRPLVSVRDRDVYVLHSLHGEPGASVNDKLLRLLFFLGALRDAGAARVTAVLPYLAYGRKDARTKPRDPLTTRYVAALFEAVGVDRVVALEAHNLAAFQNAFRCRTEHLDTAVLFARHFAAALPAETPLAVVSPDAGGIKRAERLREALSRLRGAEAALAFMQKTRKDGRVTPGRLAGDVAGAAAILIDDLISTGTTLALAARACAAAGAPIVYAAAAHGLFTRDADRFFATEALAQVVVADSVAPDRLPAHVTHGKLLILPLAPLLANAIRRLHTGGSLVELLAPG